MTELRLQSFGLDDEETLIREQYMRQCLRKLLKQKYKRIAVVCGAWHGPVLTQAFIEKHTTEKLKDVKVKLTIYDAAGREAAVLFNGELSAGTYNYDFDASQLASGIYFYKLESNDFSQTKKMVLIK